MIELTITDGVAEVVLNAPHRLNALDPQGLRDLAAAYEQAAQAGVRALLLRGEGRAFCAGRDISGVDPTDDDAAGFLDQQVTPVLRAIADFPAPTFAAGHGACLGIGLGLLVASDVVYLADDARIGSPFANLGATLDSGGHWLFNERFGPHRTLDLIYTAELLTGAQAVQTGLFSRAFPAQELLPATRATVAKVAQGPTAAFVASKQLVAQLQTDGLGLWASVAAENQAQGRLSQTADYAEGFSAFQAKRPPQFQGR